MYILQILSLFGSSNKKKKIMIGVERDDYMVGDETMNE